MFLSKFMGNRRKGYFMGMIFVLITLIFSCVFMMAGVSHAEGEEEENEEKIVRVGWFESKFNSTDQLGRKTGYAYEYQRTVAAYTGWKYEYVSG